MYVYYYFDSCFIYLNASVSSSTKASGLKFDIIILAFPLNWALKSFLEKLN